jgi:uncharacterized protein with FMN-binding domain
MTDTGRTTGSLAGKLMLSTALILASGTYAWRMAALQDIPAAAGPATPKRLAMAQPGPAAQSDAQPMLVPETKPDPVVAEPRANDAAPATPAEPQVPAPEAPAAAAPPPAGIEERPEILASNAPSPAPQKSARYADGDYTGQPADAVWGLIQVKVSIRGGAIARVDCIDYPDHRRRSIQINEWALPLLEQEVIAAQSAAIDIVTQATTTSVGYRQTLASALAQAAP